LYYNKPMAKLYIVATPIGNLEDITLRAIRIILSVSIIACEDTRKTSQLISILNERYSSILKIPKLDSQRKLLSYYDEVEDIKCHEIIYMIKRGNDVALISEAGTPLISDPGYKLINESIKQEIKIVPIPGASSFVTAISIAGLPTSSIWHIGYLPDLKIKRIKMLDNMQKISNIAINKPVYSIFLPPHKIRLILTDIREIFGNVDIIICRELTKIYEEIIRINVDELLNNSSVIKGELVLLFRAKV